MRFWIDWTEDYFLRDLEGREIFYPFGKMGRGRIVPDQSSRRMLKRRLAWTMAGTILAFAIGRNLATRTLETRLVADMATMAFGAALALLMSVLLWMSVRTFAPSDHPFSRPRSKIMTWSAFAMASAMTFALIVPVGPPSAWLEHLTAATAGFATVAVLWAAIKYGMRN